MNVSIYGIKDPRNGIIRYIGQSTNPALRLAQHGQGAGNQQLYSWMCELHLSNIEPELEILEVVSDDMATERETVWIDRLKSNLFNISGITKKNGYQRRAPVIRKRNKSIISILLSEKDREILGSAAKCDELPISSWIRTVALKAARRRK